MRLLTACCSTGPLTRSVPRRRSRSPRSRHRQAPDRARQSLAVRSRTSGRPFCRPHRHGRRRAVDPPARAVSSGFEPLAAISSDLFTSLVMKPVGGAVHLRHRTGGMAPGRLALRRVGCPRRSPARCSSARSGTPPVCRTPQTDHRYRAVRLGRADDRAASCWTAGAAGGTRQPASPPTRTGRWSSARCATVAIGVVGGSRGRHDLGRCRLGDHRTAAARLPDAAAGQAGRHRHRAGDSRWWPPRHWATCCSVTCSSRSPPPCCSARCPGSTSAPGCPPRAPPP